jgi:hypothetical protein
VGRVAWRWTSPRIDEHIGEARKYFVFEKRKNFCSFGCRFLYEQYALNFIKSFLVLFFKKELLPWRLSCFAGELLSTRVGIMLRRGVP